MGLRNTIVTMKRIYRFLLIGLLHSSIYLWLLPNIIIPNVSEEKAMIARIITSVISIIITVSIVRLSRFVIIKKSGASS